MRVQGHNWKLHSEHSTGRPSETASHVEHTMRIHPVRENSGNTCIAKHQSSSERHSVPHQCLNLGTRGRHRFIEKPTVLVSNGGATHTHPHLFCFFIGLRLTDKFSLIFGVETPSNSTSTFRDMNCRTRNIHKCFNNAAFGALFLSLSKNDVNTIGHKDPQFVQPFFNGSVKQMSSVLRHKQTFK